MKDNQLDDPASGLPLFDERMRIEDLAAVVRAIAGEITSADATAAGRHGARPAEHGAATLAETVDGGVVPLLRQLRWDVDDGDTVARGFETAAGAVDFALCGRSGDPRVLVQVGALPGAAHDRELHPFDDTSIRAVQVAVSADGRGWRFHFPAGRGSLRNREFVRFDIVDDEGTRVAEVLHAYVDRHAVQSGESLRQAEADYRERRFPAEAHAAWRRALGGPELLKRFRREMEEAIGVAPAPERSGDFVRGQLASVRWPADPPDPRPARRVGVGDRVWVHDLASREIVERRVVGRDPKWDRGEVSAESSVGHALLGAREGDTRDVSLPDGERRVRIVLIGGRSGER